jgi:tetratricopeptide (TPR) repeat protein
MPTYLWTAKDRSGQTVAREVTADSVEQSKKLLLDEGCTDLVLKGDEIYEQAQKSFGEPSKIFGEDIEVTAEDKLKFHEAPPPTFLRCLVDGVREETGLLLVSGAACGWLIYRHRYWFAGLVAAAAIGWMVFRVFAALPGIYYRKLVEAREWHRWKEVLAIVDRCEAMNRRHFLKLPAPELANSRAKALVGLGKLQEGITELQRVENEPGMPSWLFKSNLAALYDIAKQHDNAIECMRQAIAEQPTHALYIDLAHRLLLRKRDAAAGRTALAEADKETQTEMAKPFVLRCRGMIASLQGDYVTARREFEEAEAELLAHANRPFHNANLALTRALLASVLGRLGEFAAGRKTLAKAEKYLVAAKETELLQEARSLLSLV